MPTNQPGTEVSAEQPADGPILSHYFRFERGERVQYPGKLATFWPASGLAYYDGLTLEQQQELDALIRTYLDRATALRENPAAPAAPSPESGLRAATNTLKILFGCAAPTLTDSQWESAAYTVLRDARANVAGPVDEGRELAAFEAWAEAERKRRWFAEGCDRDRGPVPSESWCKGLMPDWLAGWKAGRALTAEAAPVQAPDLGWTNLVKIAYEAGKRNAEIDALEVELGLAASPAAPEAAAVRHFVKSSSGRVYDFASRADAEDCRRDMGGVIYSAAPVAHGGEPVAYRGIASRPGTCDYIVNDKPPSAAEVAAMRSNGYRLELLYASPPAREGLTESQVECGAIAMAEQHWNWHKLTEEDRARFRVRARAVLEAAHGIQPSKGGA